MPLTGVQEEAFGAADPEHFRWVTTHAVVSARERALVEASFLPLGERPLDIGCGEGSTLFHLGAPEAAMGVDASEAKVAFCREQVPGPRFECADAESLPFEAASFDHVIVRDLVHHLVEPEAALKEIVRVLEPGGRLDLLEPCAFNPLVAMHAVLTPAERGELRSTPRRLERLLRQHFRQVEVTRHQPLPLHRLLFHPQLGRPAWRWAQQPVAAVETLAGRLLPTLMWSYIHLRAR